MQKLQPLLVIVSGSPGSGKSTLARLLAEELRVLHFERDIVFESMQRTVGDSFNRKRDGIPAFYRLMTEALRCGISLVIDGTLYVGISENDIQQFFPLAHVVNVHCRAEGALERFENREIARANGEVPEWLPGLLNQLHENHAQVAEPLDLSWETLEVDTTDGYNPTVQSLAADILAKYKSTKENI